MFKRILVATDGSTLSKKAVASAIELAAAHEAGLVALTVVPRYPKSYLDGAMAFSPEDIARVEKQWADKAQAMLDGIETRATAAGVQLKAVVANSDRVAESIIAAARKHRADLIVMASHGRKGIQRLLLGSETQHVLAESKLPVLVLR
ncbi:nucleotide-binding universal stress UspA family protein [Variovorax sp. TBS-050B]|jgi:nucleotide-binding universal stress UspA family protein|uniref:universal stress protein n=1 Tax=Variovorax sp. TBS-050B TaxID=2940551 RepID=UPI002474E068|nr:universal stress protein [Variovorax sp. TBS-050B]MDH6594389.1 nucleotide-binding universal stress UspA family protein [Variovorax sp. TBS-050B]